MKLTTLVFAYLYSGEHRDSTNVRYAAVTNSQLKFDDKLRTLADYLHKFGLLQIDMLCLGGFTMPTSVLTMLQPQAQNKCPDCLYVKLTGIPKSTDLTQRSAIGNAPAAKEQAQIDLYLTINFNEQWENIIGGRVKLGLKGGELRLKLDNATMPYEAREIASPLQLIVPKKRVKQEGNKVQNEIKAEFRDLGALTSPISKGVLQANVQTEQTQGRTDEFQLLACQLTTKGSEENPAWVFAVETDQPVLKGLLKRVLLGTLNVEAKPCHVKATFEVTKRDIYITDAEGLWPPNISRNKLAVLERIIALRLLESKFQPYVSRAELHYE